MNARKEEEEEEAVRARSNERELSFRHRKETRNGDTRGQKETDSRLERERAGPGETETVRKSGVKTGERERWRGRPTG